MPNASANVEVRITAVASGLINQLSVWSLEEAAKRKRSSSQEGPLYHKVHDEVQQTVQSRTTLPKCLNMNIKYEWSTGSRFVL
jgi:hypothetical protein